jgi:hypothetical protein
MNKKYKESVKTDTVANKEITESITRTGVRTRFLSILTTGAKISGITLAKTIYTSTIARTVVTATSGLASLAKIGGNTNTFSGLEITQAVV